MTRIAIAALVATVWTSCVFGPRPSHEQCEKACLKRAKLYHDDQWSKKISAASETERAQLEKQRALDWQRIATSDEPKACVAHCNRPGNQEQVDCIMKAETLAEARACTE